MRNRILGTPKPAKQSCLTAPPLPDSCLLAGPAVPWRLPQVHDLLVGIIFPARVSLTFSKAPSLPLRQHSPLAPARVLWVTGRTGSEGEALGPNAELFPLLPAHLLQLLSPRTPSGHLLTFTPFFLVCSRKNVSWPAKGRSRGSVETGREAAGGFPVWETLWP